MVAINAKVIFRFEEVISSNFQTNINLHMFRDEFVAKKGFFTSTGVLIFPRENDVVPLS